MKRKDPTAALKKAKHSQIGRKSKNKGSAFERLTGSMLSYWITGGDRGDLFSRNVLSGGRFTNAVRNKSALGVPGDLMAAHPLAFDFLSSFMIECKHYKELGIHQYLMDDKGKSFIGSVINQTAYDAAKVGLLWMLVAKQNLFPTLIFLPRRAFMVALKMESQQLKTHHMLHSGMVGMMRFEDFLFGIDPQKYLKALKAVKEIEL